MPFLLAVLLLPRPAAAQAVPRTDTPKAGTLRVTFEPVITTWEQEFTGSGKRPIGASLPATILVREERRVTPIAVEYGITNRVAASVKLPLVRVNTRATYPLDSTGAPMLDSATMHLDSLLNDTTYGFGSPTGTDRHRRYFAGDIEIQGKYRLLELSHYALSGALTWRLPTGHQDSPNNMFDLSTGDHVTAFVLQIAQEATLFERAWLNLSLTLGRREPGQRDRRVGPQSALLLPHAALMRLNWDPGDYAAIDAAPLYRFNRSFGAGLTIGYYTQARDRYTYRSAQDSVTLATRLGTPISASVLDAGTALRWTRLGVAVTYVGPVYEGSLSVEQTVTGSGGLVPAATVFRIVMRTSRWPF